MKKWDLADPNVWPEFETAEQCSNRQGKVVSELKANNYVPDPETGKGAYDDHITMLIRCRRGEPCNSPVCPVCTAAYRRWFVSHGLKAFESYDEILFLTWVPEPDCPQSVPFKFKGGELNNSLQMRLKRLLPPGVLPNVIVWGMEEFKFERKFNCVIPHIHCMVVGCTKDELKLIGGKRKPLKDRIIFFPIVIKRQGREQRVDRFSYTCKTHHQGTRWFPRKLDEDGKPIKPKKPENPKRKKMREEMKKKYIKLGGIKYTKHGYQKLLVENLRNPSAGIAYAEFLALLSGLSLHDLPVLRGITRKGTFGGMDWRTRDELFKRRARGMVRR